MNIIQGTFNYITVNDIVMTTVGKKKYGEKSTGKKYGSNIPCLSTFFVSSCVLSLSIYWTQALE